MKIAYLNPWENAAENQAYKSLAIGAARKGHVLIDCRVSEDVERVKPDFVLSVASSVPKVVDFPSYLTVHEPKRRFLESEFYFRNLLSYDGFLTVSDNLTTFIRNVCFGIGRDEEVGFYFNTPQTTTLRANIAKLGSEDALKVVYLGTNWDRRMPVLFQLLDDQSLMIIHGPRASWEPLHYYSYKGPLPFDGISPQLAYSRAGIGLVLLSEQHLREDIISNRIFEIASVGAVAICPESPWVRKWFGESVLYFDARVQPVDIAAQIISHYKFCLANPAIAQAKADAARVVFEHEFSAERMIANAVAYHHRKQELVHEDRPAEPDISVIMRCGGRPLSFVKQAVDSIRSQSLGRFTVILSKFRDVDLSEITSDHSGRIVEFMEVVTEGGTRGATLAAGLKFLRTTYFAILDDDDFWLSNHVESLFSAAQTFDPSFDVVFSGTVAISAEKRQIEQSLRWNRNIYTFGFGPDMSSPANITAGFSSNCFVARTAVLPTNLEVFSRFNTAEDSLLVALIARRKRPVFSYRATAFFRRGFAGESDWANRKDRGDDELAWALCSSMQWAPRWIASSGIHFPMNEWRRQQEVQDT